MAKFIKGQSGNPGGRPKVVGELRELARERTQEALDTLVSIMKDTEAPPAARVSASCAILDRGYGRPCQQVEFESTAPEKQEGPADIVDLARKIAFVLAAGNAELRRQTGSK